MSEEEVIVHGYWGFRQVLGQHADVDVCLDCFGSVSAQPAQHFQFCLRVGVQEQQQCGGICHCLS